MVAGADLDLSTRCCFLRPGSRGCLGPWWGAGAMAHRGLGGSALGICLGLDEKRC